MCIRDRLVTADSIICLDPSKEYYVVFDISGDSDLDEFQFSTGTADAACIAGGESDDVDPLTGTSGCFDPEQDDDDMNIDAGINSCQTLAGEIFYDLNNNGCEEAGETLVLEEVLVSLFECISGTNSGGIEVASTTITDGTYEFGPSSATADSIICLDPSKEYYVVFDISGDTDLDEFQFSTGTADAACITGGESDDIDPMTGTSSCFDPELDDDDMNIDAGINSCQTLAGEIFYDLNNNGCEDAGENLVLEDVLVSLFECSAGTNSGGIEVASTTIIDGTYEFLSLIHI